jgi:hypothetical protein
MECLFHHIHVKNAAIHGFLERSGNQKNARNAKGENGTKNRKGRRKPKPFDSSLQI